MSNVLDQNEIDALLAAVGGDAPAEAAAPTVVQSSKSVAASAAAHHGAPAEAPPVNTYDFKRPERVSKEHIRALASIHDGFARNFGATLSGMLRTIIDVRVVGVEQLTYSEFIHSLPNPTCFLILQAPPLEGQMCLEVSPLIVYPIVDRLLGGSSGGMFIPQRALTSIEWRIVSRIVDRALEQMSEVWKNLVDAKFQVVEQESNPQLVHIVAPTEVVVFITFEIKMGNAAGTMSMCVPFNTIESVLSRLTTQSWFGYRPKTATDLQKQRIFRNLRRTRVPLTAFVGSAKIKVSDLRTLRTGDVIQLDKEAASELILQIGGRTKFAGRAGQLRGRRALRITRRAPIDEPI
ncbi:MAG: flagellar motor switch protein FliM [Phycisphaerae bacterium]|nr:flagellar motor switch protein FliM [Phycisphaerae bacterium]